MLLYRQGDSIVRDLWIGSAGGHFEKDELHDARKCVLRELMEELDIPSTALQNLSLRYITLRYTDGEVRQNYYFFADLIDPSIECPISTEGIIKWFRFHELSDLKMPVTARYMMDHYLKAGQFDDCLYGGISNGSSLYFTKL